MYGAVVPTWVSKKHVCLLLQVSEEASRAMADGAAAQQAHTAALSDELQAAIARAWLLTVMSVCLPACRCKCVQEDLGQRLLVAQATTYNVQHDTAA
jgi:hypothetical protein